MKEINRIDKLMKEREIKFKKVIIKIKSENKFKQIKETT